MALERWSEKFVVTHLGDDPLFAEDMLSLAACVRDRMDVVLDFAGVRYVNSSNISQLLRLRKLTISAETRLMICGINTQIWGVFLITGLDKVFEFADDVTNALATLQMGQ